MAHYSFSIENGKSVPDPDTKEDLANDQAAIDHAKLIVHDLRVCPETSCRITKFSEHEAD